MHRASNALGIAAALLLAACSPQGGPGGGIDKSGDAQLQGLVADVMPQFRQGEYIDAETGLTIPYNLYVPPGNAGGQGADAALPMVTFIADSSVVGQDVTAPLEQGLGGLIWASPEDQARHPAIVLVPEFPEVTIDDHGGSTITDYVEATRRMVLSVAREQGADTARLYATGQSMGCMMFLLLSARYPDLFAAELFVSGQWDTEALAGLAGQRFAYIVSAGDAKASAGQAELREALVAKGVTIASTGLDGKAPMPAQEAAVAELLAQGEPTNFLTFEAGSVLPEGVTEPGGAGDHMYSFDPAYRLTPLRNWLFEGG